MNFFFVIDFCNFLLLNHRENENERLREANTDIHSKTDNRCKVYEERISEYTKEINQLEINNEELK